MRLAAACGVLRERLCESGRDEQRGDDAVCDLQRPPALRVEQERERPERQDVEEVALLDVVEVSVDDGLCEQRDREQDDHDAERELRAGPRLRQAEPETEDRARDEHEPRREGEHDRVGAEELRSDGEVEVRDVEEARVVAAVPCGAEGEEPDGNDDEQPEQHAVLPQEGKQPALAQRDDEHRDEKDRQKHRELHAGERREHRDAEEQRVAPPGRPVERVHGGEDRHEHDRVRDRLGHDEAGKEERRNRQAQHCSDERVARAQVEAPREQVHGDRRE